MKNKLIWIVAFASSLFFSQASFSWGGCGEGLSKMVGSLKLEDAQTAKIQPILEQFKSAAQNAGTQIGDLDKQIKELVNSANVDPSKVEPLIDQKAKLIGDIMKAKFNATIQILAILTPEQKTQLQGKINKMEDKMAEKFKNCRDDS